MTEQEIELSLIEKLRDLKYTYRKDIRDHSALEKNFRQKFQELNKINLTDAEFDRLLEQIVTPDVFSAAKMLRERRSFERDDGTPLHYTLVNRNLLCWFIEKQHQYSSNGKYDQKISRHQIDC